MKSQQSKKDNIMTTQENRILDEIVKMTPEEKIVFDKGVEEMKGEICGIHGDVCECSEDTKRKIWEDRKIPF